jgi:sterol desaturase/sphingolipid hydroxylase (fatty acid hydroxylase superfamily)
MLSRFHRESDMTELFSLLDGLLSAWKAIPLGPVKRDLLKALIFGLCLFCIYYPIERSYHVHTQYRSRMFAHDVVYWFYYGSGLHSFLVYWLILAAIEKPLSSLDSFLGVTLLSGLPLVLQLLFFVLVSDLITYWVHRAQHHYRFLWAFHTTHHSQVALNFATSRRSHPLDTVILSVLNYVPLRILGAPAEAGVLLYIAIALITTAQHSQIPSGYGFLYRIIVSPRFHAYHHSVDPAHHNKNFGSVFSFWDYLFGTAVMDDSRRPVRFGLDNVKPTSLWSTLVAPFHLLREFYFSPAENKAGESR